MEYHPNQEVHGNGPHLRDPLRTPGDFLQLVLFWATFLGFTIRERYFSREGLLHQSTSIRAGRRIQRKGGISHLDEYCTPREALV